MSDQLFGGNDSVLNILLNLANPHKRDIEEADRLLSHMSVAARDVTKEMLQAGRTVPQVVEHFARLKDQVNEIRNNASALGLDPKILAKGGRILEQYTAQRVEDVGKFSEMRRQVAPETSTAAALRDGLREWSRTRDLEQRQKTGYRVTGDNPIGTGVVFDVETAYRPGHGTHGQYLASISAQKVQFIKETGEVVGRIGQMYTALNDVQADVLRGLSGLPERMRTIVASGIMSQLKFPKGLDVESLRGQSINHEELNRLFRSADVGIGHNAARFDRNILSMLPAVQQIPILDSFTGIDWRSRGHNDRRLQTLARLYNINAGEAHTSASDVNTNIALLSARDPRGGPTPMAELLGNLGPITNQNQIYSQMYRELAFELKRRLEAQLGISQLGQSDRYIRRTNQAALDVEGEGLIGRLGPAQMVIPNLLGHAEAEDREISKNAEHLPYEDARHHQLSQLNEFLGRQGRYSAPGPSAFFVSQLGRQLRYQENKQSYAGKKRVKINESEKRSAERLFIAAITGLNTSLRLTEEAQELGIPERSPNSFFENPSNSAALELEKRRDRSKNLLSQDWAKPYLGVAGMRSIGGLPGQGLPLVQRAAKMANVVGEGHPSYNSLLKIVEKEQEAGQRSRAVSRLRPKRDVPALLAAIRGNLGAVDDVATPTAARPDHFFRWAEGIPPQGREGFGDYEEFRGGRWRPTLGSRVRRLTAAKDAYIGFNPEKDPVDASANSEEKQEQRSRYSRPRRRYESDPGQRGSAGGMFADLDALFRGAANLGRRMWSTLANSGAPGQQRDPLEELRGLKRQNAFDRLDESLRKAEQALNEFANSVAPQKKQVLSQKYEEAVDRAQQAYSKEKARIDSRTSKALQSGDARSAKIQSTREDIESKAAEERAKLNLDFYKKERATSFLIEREENLRASAKFKALPKQQQELRLSQLANQLEKAETEEILAQYKVKAFGAQNSQELLEARKEAANRLANTLRYGADDPARAGFIDRAMGFLPVTRSTALARAAKDEELTAEKKKIEQERAEILAQAEQDRAAAAAKFRGKGGRITRQYVSAIDQIDSQVTSRQADLKKREVEVNNRKNRLNTQYALEDEIRGGGPGGRGPGSGRGGAGGGTGGHGGLARSGFDFGIGLAALAGYGVALKEITFDTVQYAARTEQLRVVTEQMARTNGVSTQSLNGYVEATKRSNVTTQEAYSHIQKMIQANLDVAKAPALIRVTQNLSAITGRDPMAVLESVTMGLVTGYTRQLHQAGLQVSRLSVNRKLRGTLDHEPNETEQREGLLDAILIEGARTSGTFEKSLATAAGQMQLLKIQVQETKNAIGNEFIPVYGRMLQIINSGLKVMEQNPVGTSRGAAVGVAINAALSAAGTGAFLKWAAGSVAKNAIGGPVGAALTIGGIALGAYEFLTPDPDKISNRMALSAADRLDIAKKGIGHIPTQQEIDAATGEQKKTLEFTREYRSAELESYNRAQRETRTQQLMTLARSYNENMSEYNQMRDGLSGKQGLTGFLRALGTSASNYITTGSAGGRRAIPGPWVARPAAPFSKEFGITPEQVREQAEALKKQQGDAVLDPNISEQRQLKLARAVGALNQAQVTIDQLERGFEPNGSERRARRRIIGRDNPLERIELEYQDFAARLDPAFLKKQLDTVREELTKSRSEPGKENFVAQLEKQLREFEIISKDRDVVVGKEREKADLEIKYLKNRNELQKQGDLASIAIARVRGQVVQGNYASEKEAIEETHRLQTDLAQRTLQGTRPLEYETKISEIGAQRQIALAQVDSQQVAAARARRETLAQAEGNFAAQQAYANPQLTDRQKILEGYQEEMKAVNQLSNDEERRNRQLELTLQLRSQLVEAGQKEVQSIAQFDTARDRNRYELENMIGRVQAGRGAARPGYRGEGRSRNDLALEAIEDERRRGFELVDREFNRQAALPNANPKDIERGRQLAREQIDLKADAERLAQLDRNRQNEQEQLADTYRVQAGRAARVAQLQAYGPGAEVASIGEAHNFEMQAIQQVFEARGKGADAEREKRKAMMAEEFQYAEKILSLRKQKYEEARNVTGGLFDAFVENRMNGNAFAVPQFLQRWALGQAKTMFQNFTSDSVNSVFGNVTRVFGGQHDKNGHATMLGKIMGGTVFGAIPGDPQKILADITKESITAEVELKNAVASLDSTIQALDAKLKAQAGTSVNPQDYGRIGQDSTRGINVKGIAQAMSSRLGSLQPIEIPQMFGIAGMPGLSEQDFPVLPSYAYGSAAVLNSGRKTPFVSSRLIPGPVSSEAEALLGGGPARAAGDVQNIGDFLNYYVTGDVNKQGNYTNNLLKGMNLDPSMPVSAFAGRIPELVDYIGKYESGNGSLGVAAVTNNPGNLLYAGQTGAIPYTAANGLTYAKFENKNLGKIALTKDIMAKMNRFGGIPIMASSGMPGGGFAPVYDISSQDRILNGSVPIRTLDPGEPGMGGIPGMPNAGMSTMADAPTLPKYVSPVGSYFGSLLSSLGGSQYNTWDLIKGSASISGVDEDGHSVKLKNSGAARIGDDSSQMMHLTKMQRMGALSGDALTAVGGFFAAKQQFKRGGAKGTAGGIAAALGTAAMLDPEPISKMILGAAALGATLFGALIPDPRARRQAQINEYMQLAKYNEPVPLNAMIAASGGQLVGQDRFGMSRGTGLAQFPFNLQNNLVKQARVNTNKPGHSYLFLPGRDLGPTGALAGNSPYNPGYMSPTPLMPTASGGTTNINFNLPVSAMDGSDVLRRSPDIAAALVKEMKLGGGESDLGYHMNRLMFGAG